ncbi:MAG: Rne/Rng family ribonuclease [Pirellulales bacterium]|nr:Rne/Rng family ribonuclease [Pirellulales bacterium]
MKQEMLINVAQSEECRIAIVEDGQLEELYLERTSQQNYVGNIYKGRIVNLEPSIQAAFVDFGVGRNGFLHISDVEPQYFRQGGYDPKKAFQSNGGRDRDRNGGGRGGPSRESEDNRSFAGDFEEETDDDRRESFAERGEESGVEDRFEDEEVLVPREGADFSEGRRDRQEARRGPGGRRNGQGPRGPRFRPGVRPRFKPPIQDIFQRGDEVLVQVIKEGIGTKGPTLSTYISIPGRYLVLMPALGRIGVSRKIENDDDRHRLRDILRELNPPKGVGFIVRTAGTDRTKKELSRDLAYLLRLWKVIVRRIKNTSGPVDIYEESDMIIRTIRDIFTAEVDSIQIDEPKAFERAKEFLQIVMPRYVSRLKLYEGREPLFQKYNLDQEIALINQRKVPLRGGGSLVIDQTEALVAIDVNSGSFRTDGSAEDSAYQLNQIAAKEIARQLRLRDLGGVIVNDFIDMRKERNRRNVERTLRDAVRRDRARTKILRTSPFGLIEMTRQRIRPSIKRSVYKECPACTGSGLVKSSESMAIEVARKLQLVTSSPQVARVVVTVEEEVANYLNNKKRRELVQLESDHNVEVQILGGEGLSPEYLKIECQDASGREVRIADV